MAYSLLEDIIPALAGLILMIFWGKRYVDYSQMRKKRHFILGLLFYCSIIATNVGDIYLNISGHTKKALHAFLAGSSLIVLTFGYGMLSVKAKKTIKWGAY